ncbi:MAG: 4'-phosphopantetheinyl transferase superfamily protein [Candidatus Contendobacter sp.]|nr:4'-phosphopantetheinyl transferase superfamily protein [Candidatus Contendobacter sp.]MDG4556408.1 4'-phosphopantetheinyl transferase superfamily protein [Candidatus Contendobacter sp.]
MAQEIGFHKASSHPELAADEVHLWLATLDRPPLPLPALAATLTVDERERAARFRFSEHRDRFIAGRGLLRELLGRYLDRSAAALRIEPGAHGKPALAGADIGAELHFNLSHSSDRVLYAVAHREVGVDLERLDRSVNHAAIIERVCAPREWAAFRALPAERLQSAFFACWTRKEAIAKALGGGLASGLRTFEVCCRPDVDPDKRASVRDGQGREWSVLNLEPESGWIGALAAMDADWRWRGWRWA